MERLTELLTVRMTPRQMAELRAMADCEGRPLGNMVRWLIEKERGERRRISEQEHTRRQQPRRLVDSHAGIVRLARSNRKS